MTLYCIVCALSRYEEYSKKEVEFIEAELKDPRGRRPGRDR